jgi:hypothetical protein
MSDCKEAMVEGPSESNRVAGPISRRTLLKTGALFGAGLAVGLGSAASTSAVGHARSVILVYLHGGPSHLDLWDPKPALPESMRSPFKPIPTRLDDIEYTELLPRLAGSNHLFTTIRSMRTLPAGVFYHDAAVYQMLCGREPAQVDHMGKVTASCVDVSAEGFGAGQRMFSRSRITSRAPFLAREKWPRLELKDLSDEPAKVRERYGVNWFGDELLHARRLVESGAPLVRVDWRARSATDPYSWDLHDQLAENMQRYSAPMLDRAVSALFEDLEARGRLNEVLVAVLGEFGRSPLKGVSTSGNYTGAQGRDHWPYCYSALIGGGGVKRGFAYGESDESGAHPAKDPVTPGDLLSTISHAVGMNVSGNFRKSEPPGGRVITELLA